MLTSPRRLLAVLAIAGTLAVPTTAAATTSISSGNAHCIVTARPVKIDAMSQIWGSAVVQCDVAAVLKLDMRVVEMDGAVIDPTVVIGTKSWTVTVTPNTPMVITTNKVSCVNTEAGNEEYSTRAKVSMFGLQSATDFTIPANDSYAC
jgi:hypothetical protein